MQTASWRSADRISPPERKKPRREVRKGFSNCVLRLAVNARASLDETLALCPLAGQLARTANGLCTLAGFLFGRLLEVIAPLHFTEQAFTLHLLLERLQCLVDIVIANHDLNNNHSPCLFRTRRLRSRVFPVYTRYLNKQRSYHKETAMPTPQATEHDMRLKRVMERLIPFAATDGWNAAMMDRAIPPGDSDRDDLTLLAPMGARDLVPLYFDYTLQAVDAVFDGDGAPARIRDRVTAAACAWFSALDDAPEASRRAVAWCTLHPLGPLPLPHLAWTVADRIWTAMGDTSSGFTHASKRTTLSLVIGSTLTVWSGDTGSGDSYADGDATWRTFLDHRIENVMQFETFKRKVMPKAG